MAFAIWGLVGVAACGGGGGPGGGAVGGKFTAKIDGKAWASTAGAETVGAQHASTGLYSITGLAPASPGITGMVFQLFNIGPAGTYSLGVGLQVFGGSASVSSAAGGWATPLSGAAGEIVFATLTDTHMTGTFSFTAAPLPGSTGTHQITDGRFDLPVVTQAGVTPLPENVGSKVTGTIGGMPFAAASATSILTTSMSPTLTITAGNLDRNLTISIAELSGPGTFALSASTPVRSVQVSGAPGDFLPTWNSQVAAPGGSVVIASMTAARIVGTFVATLSAIGGGATGTLDVSGAFDLGRR